MSRAALAILSTENLLHNLSVIRKHARGAKIMAMVKANAYGHGIRTVARRLDPHVYGFGVASIDEALVLRKVGIKKPILLLEGVFEPDELMIASCERLQVVFHTSIQLQWLRTAILPTPLTVWLKVDTGLGRLGFSLETAHQAYAELSGNPQINRSIGILSHFSCADQSEHPLNELQIKNFNNFAQQYQGPKSLCNSAALFSFVDQQYDVVRPGIALYGVSPFAHVAAESLGLKPVMSLHTRLIAVREMKKGDPIGYSGRFVCPEDMMVGVVAMGYGDGYPRTAQDGTPVLVNGIRCPLVGRVSMDMMTVDLRPCPTAHVGSPVVLWGPGLTLEEVAQHTGHIPYDILTAVQTRVKFHWTLDGEHEERDYEYSSRYYCSRMCAGKNATDSV